MVYLVRWSTKKSLIIQNSRTSLIDHQRMLATIDIFYAFIAKINVFYSLTLTVLVATIDAQWEGMGDVGSARYKPALLPPCPTIRALSYSNW